MKNLENVKAKIIKANDDIIKLQFGCEFLIKKNTPLEDLGSLEEGKYSLLYVRLFGDKKKLIVDYLKRYGDGSCGQSTMTGFEMLRSNGNIEILGRPITFEDVLVALKEQVIPSFHYLTINELPNNGDDISEYKEGWFILVDGFWIYWQLNKPLHEQSEETINFLDEIL